MREDLLLACFKGMPGCVPNSRDCYYFLLQHSAILKPVNSKHISQGFLLTRKEHAGHPEGRDGTVCGRDIRQCHLIINSTFLSENGKALPIVSL